MLNSGEIRYTPPDGTPALKKAIIRYTEEFYGFRPAPENVMASGGAKQAIMSALHAVLDPQGEVIYPGALLGELPRDGPAGGRDSGAGRRPRTAPSSRGSRTSSRWSAPTPRW